MDTTNSVTLEDVRKALVKLEFEVQRAVNAFSAKTGTAEVSINIMNVHHPCTVWSGDVKVTVKLDANRLWS